MVETARTRVRGDSLQFPPAPWNLRGEAIVACRLVPERVARSFLPADARIVCVWPGRTIAVAYLARYEESPVGDYHECILAPALARVRGKTAFWISHILVNRESSLHAGRSIWSLPKAAGAFAWDAGGNETRVQLTSNEITVRASFKPRRGHLRLPFAGPAMSRCESMSKRFVARGMAGVAAVRGDIEVTGDSPAFAQLGFQRSRTLFALESMRLTIDEPATVDGFQDVSVPPQRK